MIVFEHGSPKKSHYRRFKIRDVRGQDDFASMREVLERRFERWRQLQSGALKGVRGSQAWAKLPDLLVVDGGKGQLGVAVEVLQRFELQDRVPVIGLAKRYEEVFLPGQREPVRLPETAPGLLLLQRVRDEAHRFAITYHRQRRRKVGLASQIDEIPGIGPVRRKALLKRFGSLHGIRAASVSELMERFGSLHGIRAASVSELMEVPGISRVLAEQIRAHFDQQARAEDEETAEALETEGMS